MSKRKAEANKAILESKSIANEVENISEVDFDKDNSDNLEAEAIRLVNKFNSSIVLLKHLQDKTILTCPRCLRTNAKIIGSCTNTSCYLFSEKMSYNCYSLHSALFYPDSDMGEERRAAEIALNISERSFNRLIELSVFALRASTIILKYLTEYSEGSHNLTFYTKRIRRILSSSPDEVLCGSCGSPHSMNKHCLCVENARLRDERLSFQERWKLTINKPREYNIEVLNKRPKDIISTYGKNIHSLGFTRFLLKNISLDGIEFTNIPLGFILSTYDSLFKDAPWRISENLGVTEQLYTKALELFNNEG